jgi:hypothetical protein
MDGDRFTIDLPWAGVWTMAADVDASGSLLLGMLALRQGLIDQVQLLAAFEQWLAAGPRTLGEILVEQGVLDPAARSRLERLAYVRLESRQSGPELSLNAAILKQQAELHAYDERLRHSADKKIALALDDGVKVNYGKFGDLHAEVKSVTGARDEEWPASGKKSSRSNYP